MVSRANAGNVISLFGNAPRDASHNELFYAKNIQASDASTTPVNSPVTGATPITLNIPENAVAVVLAHDATAVTSTFSFNGQPGNFGLVANQLVTIPCAGESFTTIAITPGASTSVYFAFELI